jgi:hypothetical protein
LEDLGLLQHQQPKLALVRQQQVVDCLAVLQQQHPVHLGRQHLPLVLRLLPWGDLERLQHLPLAHRLLPRGDLEDLEQQLHQRQLKVDLADLVLHPRRDCSEALLLLRLLLVVCLEPLQHLLPLEDYLVAQLLHQHKEVCLVLLRRQLQQEDYLVLRHQLRQEDCLEHLSRLLLRVCSVLLPHHRRVVDCLVLRLLHPHKVAYLVLLHQLQRVAYLVLRPRREACLVPLPLPLADPFSVLVRLPRHLVVFLVLLRQYKVGDYLVPPHRNQVVDYLVQHLRRLHHPPTEQ